LPPRASAGIREATVQAGLRRVRPCLMTSATTILALLPMLTSTGRGSDITIPVAIPSVGGMSLVLLTMFTVPVLFAWSEERRLRQTRAHPWPVPFKHHCCDHRVQLADREAEFPTRSAAVTAELAFKMIIKRNRPEQARRWRTFQQQ
jgi:hypothetical protein